MTTESPPFPPEVLEKLRTIGLRIDRAGHMWHQGEEVTHPRLKQAMLRWLDVRDDGRDIIKLDAQRYAGDLRRLLHQHVCSGTPQDSSVG